MPPVSLGGARRALDEAAPRVAVKLRVICAEATEKALEMGGRILRQAGAGAILQTNVLQRIHRELTVSAQHFMISDVAYEIYGKAILGIDGRQ